MAVSGFTLLWQDFTEDVNTAFEFLLKLTPLLDKADQRCKYEAPCSPDLTGRSSGCAPALCACQCQGTVCCPLPLAGAGGSHSMVAESPSPSAFPQALTVFFLLIKGGCQAGPHFPPPPPSNPCNGAQGCCIPFPTFFFPHSCDCTNFLLQECSKQGLLSEASMNNLMAKR